MKLHPCRVPVSQSDRGRWHDVMEGLENTGREKVRMFF